MIRFGRTMRFAAAALLLAAGVFVGVPAGAVPEGDSLSTTPSNSATAIHFQNGKNYLESGLVDPAIKEFAAVLAIVPGDGDANYYMGLAQLQKNQNDEAKKYLNKAVLIDGANAAAREQLGLVALKLDDKATAMEQRDALADMVKQCGGSCDSTLTTALSSLDSALKGAPGAAEKTSSLMIERGRDGDVTYKLAVGEINQGRYTQAIALLKETANEVGPHPDILNYLGYVNRKLGNYDTAIRYYREALAINPNHKGANEYLGELYVEIGDLDRARVQLATLDRLCAFGCAEHEDLQQWIRTASAK
jgi:tetratricopeptide (TPR) repeat protein